MRLSIDRDLLAARSWTRSRWVHVLDGGVSMVLALRLRLSTRSVDAFAAVRGFLRLSTVPLTNGIVAHVSGVRHGAVDLRVTAA